MGLDEWHALRLEAELMRGLAAAAREVFEDLLEIRLEMPWPDPRGGRLFARIRPHDTASFAAVREGLKLAPKTSLQRQTEATAKTRKSLTLNGKGKSPDLGKIATLSSFMDVQGVAEPGAIALGFDTSRAYYTPEEVDSLRVGVGRELLVAIEREVDGEVVETSTGPECEAWILSNEPIPYKIPGEAPDPSDEGEQTYIALRFAGESEGRALAAWILCRSLEDERFRRRLDPLGSSLPTPREPADESMDATSSEPG